MKKYVFPAFTGLAVFFAYPSLIAYQDAASLLPSPVSDRWLANFGQAPGETAVVAHINSLGAGTLSGNAAHAATGGEGLSRDGIDPATTGSILPDADQGLSGGEIMTGPKPGQLPQRINRTLKGDRVISTAVTQPPKNFSAGSLVESQNLFEPIASDGNYELAFVKARPLDEAIEVASLIHVKDTDPDIATDLPVTVASLVRESADYVLAYGGEEEIVRSPFAAILETERPFNLIPKIGKDDHWWAAQPLPLSVFGEGEQHCLTAGIYFEARGEPVRGQAAVAQVILNRVKNPAYPNTVCGVVYQNKKWRNRCQFSFACDRIADKVRDRKRWQLASYVARETTEGRIWLTEVGSSTHYHATYVSPKWARQMKKVGRIGLHVFYRTFGGGWS